MGSRRRSPTFDGCWPVDVLTVLLATRNGGETLASVLEAYRQIQQPAGGYKLVVVDNGSTDATPALEARFRGQLPLTWMVEPTPGKNAALNRGLSAVEGDLVVLTDDDAFPHPDLLVRHRMAADANPAFSIFGGTVVARWEESPPEWLLRWVPPGPAYSLTPPSLTEGPTGPHNVLGPNMAVRAAVFAGATRFDTSIGPRGGSYAMGSETEFVRRLVRQGHAVWHVADAVVEHFVRRTQMRREWVWGRALRFGRGQFRLAHAHAPSTAVSWFGVPRYLLRAMVGQATRMLLAFASRNEEKLFLARWELNYLRGQVTEARVLRAERQQG
jgi:L-malate glycosyltransferase